MIKPCTKIYNTEVYTDENKKEWFAINGSVHYPLDSWQKEEAMADFTNENNAIERVLDEWSSWVD